MLTSAYPKLCFLPFIGVLCLLLVDMLTGCNLLSGTRADASGVQKHTFSGKLNLLSVPAPYSLPGQIVLGPDGNLWFPAVAYENFTTQKPSGAIGQLTSGGQFHFFSMPTPYTYPLSIAFGRDGKLWFSAFQGNGKLAPNIDQAPRFASGHSELGQMSQNGTFHLFTLPASTVSPGSITVGRDGNLWFTDVSSVGSGNVNKIGRVTPSGVFTEFPLTLRKATDFISHIIAGSDGNIWFSIESYLPDYSAFGEMGRITPQGVVTIFDLGKFIVPGDMTVGSDKNIWFSAGGLVGYITTKGQVHTFDPSPQAQSSNHISIGGITTNTDGALWFATVDAEVGRVTTNGSFKFYPFPPNTSFDNGVSTLDMSDLRGIVAGSDGTLWLTNDSQIGHFV